MIFDFLKNPIIKLLFSILAIFAPIKGMVLSVLFLVACDLVLGVIAAKKRGEKITSSGLKQTVVKSFVYISAILLSFIAQKYLIQDMFQIVNIVSTFIGLTECVSLLESLNEINGKPIFSVLIEKLNLKKDN